MLAACGSASSDGAAGTLPPVAPTSSEPTEPTAPTATTEPDDDWPTNPPPVVFEPDGGPIEREPFTVCWSEPRPADPDEEYEAYCADGTPEENPPVVVPIDGRVWFTFPVAGWSFTANYVQGGAVTVEQVGETAWELVVPADSPGGPVIVSGFGPQGDVHVAISLPGPTAPDEAASACVEAIETLRSGLPAYDYQPADDLIDLVDRADAVVVGVIDVVRAGDSTIEFVLADARTWGGDTAVTVFETSGTLGGDVSALEGVSAIAFVHRLDDGGFGTDVQGLHVRCPGGINHVIEPLPSDPRLAAVTELDDLLDVVTMRKAPLDPASDLYGVGMPAPDAIEVDETVPVQVWWRCAVGMSVEVGDDLYLPVGDVDGLIPGPSRPWERTDFPGGWEVVIYNASPVDGDDWVLLDAVATRIDTDTIEVGHVDGDTIAAFIRDTTPQDERPLCG